MAEGYRSQERVGNRDDSGPSKMYPGRYYVQEIIPGPTLQMVVLNAQAEMSKHDIGYCVTCSDCHRLKKLRKPSKY